MLFRDDMKAIADKVRTKVFDSCDPPVDVIVFRRSCACRISRRLSQRPAGRRSATCTGCACVSHHHTILVTGASDAAPALEVLRDPACVYRYGVFYVSSSGSGTDLSLMPKTESTFADALRAALRAHVKANQLVGLDCVTESDVAAGQGAAR